MKIAGSMGLPGLGGNVARRGRAAAETGVLDRGSVHASFKLSHWKTVFDMKGYCFWTRMAQGVVQFESGLSAVEREEANC